MLLPPEQLQKAVYNTAACSISNRRRAKAAAHLCARQKCQWSSSCSACSSSRQGNTLGESFQAASTKAEEEKEGEEQQEEQEKIK